MAPTKIGLEDLEKMYREIKDKSIIDILTEDPKKLILFRLGGGYSLQEFEKKVGFSYVTFLIVLNNLNIIIEITKSKRRQNLINSRFLTPQAAV